ncbi:MAG: ATP-binding protein [Candidatus Nezhaarchaeales archaeon]
MWKLLFSPEPKRCKKDLYDFEGELNALKEYLGQPLVVVTGLRRTGKTSLILTALEEFKVPYVFFDLRSAATSRRDLYALISHGLTGFLSKASKWGRLREVGTRFLKLVRGISISGVTVELSWGRDRPLLSEVLKALNEVGEERGEKIVIVFDELQRASGHASITLQNVIAYAYDHLRNLSFILSGSEMGVLYRFLKDSEAPLYGRAYLEVKTRRLSREESIDFLSRGFEEVGFKINVDEVEEAVNRLNGIIGWLTYYGYSKVTRGKELEEIWSEAVETAKRELENFLGYRASKNRYRTVLKLLSQGVKDWKRLKISLENLEGKNLSDRVLYDILHTLKKHAIIDEQKEFQDPLMREAAKAL